MTYVRHLLLAVAVGATVLVGLAPLAHADRAVCAWVDPNGVCLSNPLPDGTPRAPRLPLP